MALHIHTDMHNEHRVSLDNKWQGVRLLKQSPVYNHATQLYVI